jgi:hypothetical protein
MKQWNTQEMKAPLLQIYQLTGTTSARVTAQNQRVLQHNVGACDSTTSAHATAQRQRK